MLTVSPCKSPQWTRTECSLQQELHFLHEIIQMDFIDAHGRAVAQAASLRPITVRGGFVRRLVRVRLVLDRATVGQDYPIVLLCFLISQGRIKLFGAPRQ